MAYFIVISASDYVILNDNNIITIINFKLRLGFHPVAVALKRHTNKTYYIQNTDNIHIKYKYHTKYNTEKRKGRKKGNVTKKNCVLRVPRRSAPARTNAPEERTAPTPPGRPEPASQEPRKQPPATDTRTLGVRASAPNNPQRHPQPANPGHPDDGGHTPPRNAGHHKSHTAQHPRRPALFIVSAVKTSNLTNCPKTLIIIAIYITH
jgi:hypothetical protein